MTEITTIDQLIDVVSRPMSGNQVKLCQEFIKKYNVKMPNLTNRLFINENKSADK